MSDETNLEEVKPAVWTKDEASKYLGISTVTLGRLVRAGEVPHTRVGRAIRFRRVDLDLYLESKTSRKWTKHGHEEQEPEG